jgi:hypothetical protein
VRVLQVGGEPDLGQEALGADHRGQVGAEDLESDPPFVAQVVRQVDGRHPPGPDLLLEAVMT